MTNKNTVTLIDISFDQFGKMTAIFNWSGITYRFTDGVKISEIETPVLTTPVYFCGVKWDQKSGHILYNPDGNYAEDDKKLKDSLGVIENFITNDGRTINLPGIEFVKSGNRCPQNKIPGKNELLQIQGAANIHHFNGWTLLAFWDRTGDARGNSYSNFFTYGTWNFDQMCLVVRHEYPLIWKRLAERGIQVIFIP